MVSKRVTLNIHVIPATPLAFQSGTLLSKTIRQAPCYLRHQCIGLLDRAARLRAGSDCVNSGQLQLNFQILNLSIRPRIRPQILLLNFKLFECEPNAWIGNADAPAISFSEGFDFLDSAIVLVSPRPHNRQLVFEHGARYMVFEPIFD